MVTLQPALSNAPRSGFDHRLHRDDEGTVRVGVPGFTFDQYLAGCLGQIRRYGAAEPAILAALLKLLLDVATTSSSPR
ncbi:MAG TPA: DUF2254 family protein [Nocardioidaceae bacterium]|nr:DUF2254 family protein [Nocardioidaceae bacterium]